MATMTIRNACFPDSEATEVEPVADLGEMHMCIPQHIANQLRLEQRDQREVTIGDGITRRVPYVGPLEIRFRNRMCFSGAIVVGDTVVLGAMAMEDMDLVVMPKDRKIDVNPANPNFACTIVK
jgi:clan AA aspartic protease